MATSSITRNFVVEGESQVRMFADAIEQSYQESLMRKKSNLQDFTTLTAQKRWMSSWRNGRKHIPTDAKMSNTA